MPYIRKEERVQYVANIDSAVRGFCEHIDHLKAALNQSQEACAKFVAEINALNAEKAKLRQDLKVSQEANAHLSQMIYDLTSKLTEHQSRALKCYTPEEIAGIKEEARAALADRVRKALESDLTT